MILDLIEVNIFGILKFPVGIHNANTSRYVIYHGISLFFHRFGGVTRMRRRTPTEACLSGAEVVSFFFS